MKGHESKVDLTLKLEALFGDFSRRIYNDMKALHKRMDCMELSQMPSKGRLDKSKVGEFESSNNERSKQKSRPMKEVIL